MGRKGSNQVFHLIREYCSCRCVAPGLKNLNRRPWELQFLMCLIVATYMIYGTQKLAFWYFHTKYEILQLGKVSY